MRKDLSCSNSTPLQGDKKLWRAINNLFQAVKKRSGTVQGKCFNICTCECCKTHVQCSLILKYHFCKNNISGVFHLRVMPNQRKPPRITAVEAIIAVIRGLISRLLLSNRKYKKALPRFAVFVATNQPPACSCQQRAIHFTSNVVLCFISHALTIMSEKLFITEWQNYFVSPISGIVPFSLKFVVWWFGRDKGHRRF